MPQKRLLLITQWFDPEPTFKGQLFARELVKLGFDVEVLTGFPNYPGGKVYPGYRIKWLQREVIDGVRVTRVPLFPSHNQSPFGRILNYVTFAVSATIYGIIGAKSGCNLRISPTLDRRFCCCIDKVLSTNSSCL